MNTNPNERDGVPVLYPFPEGWYFIASREAIEKQKLFKKHWLGEDIVVWCDDKGGICVAESVCPHLGSDLGPEAGGRVRNGCLVCPFHGFEYDITGQCVSTPYAPAPRKARLKVFETREILNLVFAWHGIDGRSPQWDLPVPPQTGPDWSRVEFRTIRFSGHPQETTENSVDLGHLRYVHGYDSVERVGTVSTDGASLTSCFNFKRTRTIAGVFNFNFDISAVTHIHGLGFSYVEIHENSIEFDSRLWVCATPIDGDIIELTLASQVCLSQHPKRPILGMRFLPGALRSRVLNRIVIVNQERDVMQDVIIWSRKRYRPLPLLCRSDGEIGMFRRFCAQFYPDGQAYRRQAP
ncbi:MAG: Rieske 2Fe-2S domain-containing protein [Paracoccaceae bacterium]|nr:Rieske 2Fe-2S domain-containing protein [Paracoccaceae bacterium]